MKIINRYVLKEHLGPLLFALTALTSLLLLNYIAKRFGQLVGKGLSWQVIGEFFLLSIPFTVAMTIPMAVLVSTLYAFSRLAAENEITAFKASGVSVRRLLAPVLVAATALAILMIAFNDQVLPRANYRLSMLQSDIFRVKPSLLLRPRVINRVTDQLSLIANRIEQGSGRMYDVTIYSFENAERPRTIYADSATLAMTPDQRNLELVLFTGQSREFPHQEPERMERTRFTQNRVIVRDVGNQLERSGGMQAKGDREMTVCEMQARYDSTAREYERAWDRLDTIAVQAAEAGEPVTLPERRETYAENGLGALYCRLLDRVGVRSANASEPEPSIRPASEYPRTPVARMARARPAQELSAQELSAEPAQEVPAVIVDTAVAPPNPTLGGPAPPSRVSIPASAGGYAGAVEMLRVQADLGADVLNSYDVEIQKKFALAVACIIFVLLGAPIALRFPRGGVGLVIGVSLGVFALYYVCLIAGETVADRGYLPPFVAMWAANIIFGAAGLVLLVRMGNEGATSRGGDAGEMLEGLRGRLARLARRVGVPAERRSTT